MTKAVIHIFHGDPESLTAGARVADRIRRVRGERNVDLEVYISGPAVEALAKSEAEKYNELIDVLACDGIPVRTPRSTAEGSGMQAVLEARGLRFEEPHDAFMRFAIEGATVFSY